MTYRDYFRAAADGDGKKVCELMTAAARQEILATREAFGGAAACATLVGELRGTLEKEQLRGLRDAKVTTIRIASDRALVDGTGRIGEEEPARMRKVSGDWLVDGDLDAGQTVAGSGVSMRVDGGYTLTVSNARKTSALPGGDRAGGVFVIIDVRVRNHTKTVARFDHSMAQLVDAFGKIYAASRGQAEKQIDALPNYFGGREIKRGTTESGSLAFDVPKAADIVKAQFVDSLHSPSAEFTLAAELEFK